MTIRSVLVTGSPLFLHRYRPMFDAMALRFDQLDYMPVLDVPPVNPWLDRLSRKGRRVWSRLQGQPGSGHVDGLKNSGAFVQRSRRTEDQILQRSNKPDHVFHVFGMSSPFWKTAHIPFAIYLDYTMALAKRNWGDWAPFPDPKSYERWLACERRTYQRAGKLFCMSELVKASLISDYDVPPGRIFVVGSAGNFADIYEGEKTFGTQRILFNGVDFSRKGGDRVLAAFLLVRKILPAATLTVIGTELAEKAEGIVNPGNIGSPEVLKALFLGSDLVVAPGRCDPFQSFVIEAMNYGVPCIVSSVDGMPEIVDDKVNGIVLDNPTPANLAREILDLLPMQSRLKSFSEQAREKIRTRFNWDTIAKAVTEAMNS